MHPPIIRTDDFEAVEKMTYKAIIIEKPKNKKSIPENHYTKKIFCSLCGKSVLSKQSKQKNGVSFYFSCRYCIDEIKTKNNIKRATHMSLAHLDETVTGALNGLVGSLPPLEYLNEVILNSDFLKKIQAKIARERNELDDTVNHYEN
jgi:hypothetical protein